MVGWVLHEAWCRLRCTYPGYTCRWTGSVREQGAAGYALDAGNLYNVLVSPRDVTCYFCHAPKRYDCVGGGCVVSVPSTPWSPTCTVMGWFVSRNAGNSGTLVSIYSRSSDGVHDSVLVTVQESLLLLRNSETFVTWQEEQVSVLPVPGTWFHLAVLVHRESGCITMQVKVDGVQTNSIWR